MQKRQLEPTIFDKFVQLTAVAISGSNVRLGFIVFCWQGEWKYSPWFLIFESLKSVKILVTLFTRGRHRFS